MSTQDDTVARLPANDVDIHLSPTRKVLWWHFWYSPLFIACVLAIIARVWLVVHTQGVIDGDEAIVGIQAQHILRGEFPLYYYGQQYMGSLEAYFVALIFAIAGSSVWTLRTEPILLSLVLVWLTWKLATRIADAARLPCSARTWFITIATFVPALLPLYDTIIEMRMLGGYIESYIIMLWLLLSAFQLVQRWRRDASSHELALRWVGIGFLIGLGFWVNPLIVSSVLASALWIGAYLVSQVWAVYKTRQPEKRQNILSRLQKMWLVVVSLPAALVGFTPAIYWGAFNSWRNITYMLTNGSGGGLSRHRLHIIEEVTGLYTTCIAPRILGGAPPSVTLLSTVPALFTIMLVVASCFLLATVISQFLPFFWRSPTLIGMRQLSGLPLLFGICTAFVFCTSSISVGVLYGNCSVLDGGARYASPLMLALPFLYATPIALLSMYWPVKKQRSLFHEEDKLFYSWQSKRRYFSLFTGGLLVFLLLLFGIQAVTYLQTNAGYTFQTSGCLVAPANDEPIIAYMQHEHIHFILASFWIGNPIIFKTNGSIIAADPRLYTDAQLYGRGRIPAYTVAVRDADRPSVLTLISQSDVYPLILKTLDAEHITYHVSRFPSEPGVDLLVITPLHSSISPYTAHSLGAAFGGC